MRFNCQSCGAKYQIADEKVAGKTVRMKCRKCGDLIQVRAQKTGGSVAPSYSGSGAPGPVRPLAPSGLRPGGPTTPRPSSAGPFGARPSAAGPPRPRPSGIGLPPPRPSAPSASAAGLPRPTPAAPSYGGRRPASEPPDPDEATVIMQRPDQADLDAAMHKRMRPAAGGAPAPAPKPAPTPAPAPAPTPPPASLPEWYVGIDGEPVGPIDVAYLESQIDAGKVTSESLVWREELTDWKPLNTFPELRHLAEGGSSGAAMPAAEISDPVALTRLKSSAEPALAQPHSGSPADAQPAARAEPTGASEAASGAAVSTALAFATPEPAAVDSALEPPSVRGPSDSELAELAGIKLSDRRSKRRGMHPMAYAFIAMAAAFGAVAAWVLFTGKTMGGTTETTVSSAVVATGTPSGDPETPSSAEPAGSAIQIAEVDVSPEAELAMAGSTAAAVSSNAKAPPPDSKTNSAKPCNPSDPFCGPAVEGPSTGGPSGDSGQAGQGLTPAQAQSVVNSNRHAVSRRCMSYVSGKGGSAKIGVTIVIAPSGNVQSVAVSGGKDYPGLASCVKTRVQNWKFPSSGASTTVNVSFNFIAQ